MIEEETQEDISLLPQVARYPKWSIPCPEEHTDNTATSVSFPLMPILYEVAATIYKGFIIHSFTYPMVSVWNNICCTPVGDSLGEEVELPSYRYPSSHAVGKKVTRCCVFSAYDELAGDGLARALAFIDEQWKPFEVAVGIDSRKDIVGIKVGRVF